MQLKARLAVAQRDELGEGPVWDSASDRLLWGDHAQGILREARRDGAGGWRETRRWVLNRPLAAAIPRAGGGLIIAGGLEIVGFDDRAAVDSSATYNFQPFAQIDASSPLVRINDGKCDARGRLWVGTFSGDFRSGGGALYRVDPDGRVTMLVDNVTLANGLDWSPDGATFYFVDSFARTVDAFDFDEARGELSRRRTLITLRSGVPNGLCVDQDGCLWVAATGGGNVQRYASDGNYLGCIAIGTPGATSCAFGGEACAQLFITNRAGRMPEAARGMGVDPAMMDNAGPEAGALFECEPGVCGIPASVFVG